MKKIRTSLFISIALVFILFFLAGTAWLWRGYWREQTIDRVATSSAEALPEKQIIATSSAPIVISPEPLPESSPESLPKPIAISTPKPSFSRSAVSPLTGALALGPNDVNLAVPYTSQAPERNWDQPWQDACEEAAVLMIDAYYKGYGLSPLSAKDELQRMVDWGANQGWGLSIDIEKIKLFFTEYFGYKRNVRIVENPTVEQIKSFISAGMPVLAVADGKSLPNPYYSNGGPEYHVYVIRGYTADKFITNDPGVNRGANFVFPIDAVMDTLHDWNDGDVKNGRKVVLIVE